MELTPAQAAAQAAARRRNGEYGNQPHADSGLVDVEGERDLTTFTPSTIDAELYDLYGQKGRLDHQLDGWFKNLERSIGKPERGDYTPTGQTRTWRRPT